MSLKKTVPFVPRVPFLPLQIGGHDYRVKIWTYQEWDRIPVAEQPGEAREYGGIGYVEVAVVSAIQVADSTRMDSL